MTRNAQGRQNQNAASAATWRKRRGTCIQMTLAGSKKDLTSRSVRASSKEEPTVNLIARAARSEVLSADGKVNVPEFSYGSSRETCARRHKAFAGLLRQTPGCRGARES